VSGTPPLYGGLQIAPHPVAEIARRAQATQSLRISDRGIRAQGRHDSEKNGTVCSPHAVPALNRPTSSSFGLPRTFGSSEQRRRRAYSECVSGDVDARSQGTLSLQLRTWLWVAAK
jgi:hypothetical protein